MTTLPEVTTADLLSFQDTDASGMFRSDATTISIDQAKNKDTEKLNIADNSYSSEESPEATDKDKSFWSIEYYQQFFDVDTKDVLHRIASSFIPRFSSPSPWNRDKPDLYGPLWISITLIVTIAIGGNISNYLQHANSSFHWKYNFHLVSYAATTICLYVTITPLILWLLLKSKSADNIEGAETPGFLELLCLYGYSLFIFIPVSILWLIQVNIVQWSLVLLGAALSVSVLILRLMSALRLSRYCLISTVVIVALHLALAVGFMSYFFHVPDSVIPSAHNASVPVNVSGSVVNKLNATNLHKLNVTNVVKAAGNAVKSM